MKTKTNNWLNFFFLWLGTGTLTKDKKMPPPTAVQYVPKVRQSDRQASVCIHHNLLSFSDRNQLFTLNGSAPAVWSLFQFLGVDVITVVFHVKNDRVVRER